MEYVVHHVATLFLIVFSFMVGHFRIGILILVYLSLSASQRVPPPRRPLSSSRLGKGAMI